HDRSGVKSGIRLHPTVRPAEWRHCLAKLARDRKPACKVLEYENIHAKSVSAERRGFMHPLRFDSLDLLRGLAALLVLAGHARSYVFQSFFDLQQSGAPVSTLIRVFYFATGLGNQAVIIFFALSGFLVGGKALDDMLGQHFCWTRYLLRRLTRLW